LFTAFNQTYQQISDAVEERKKAEAALQKSFSQVESYSQALNKELERGRQMQNNFLPAKLLQKQGWEFSAFFVPARQVAGDFYDLFELPGNRIGLVIADVCDKGVGAALFMALFRSLIRIFSGQTILQGLECHLNDAPKDSDPVVPDSDATAYSALNAVQLTNSYIAKNHEDLAMFATLFFGVLDPQNGDLAYISGGHDPLYIIKPGGGIKHFLGPTGPAVGIQSDVRFEARRIRLEPDEVLFGYTDGVTEARSVNDDFFNEKKLLKMLTTDFESAADLLDRIAKAVKDHIGQADQFDDITMLAIRRLPA
jgi:serine phosphatase RsbU (regulator of sigma subunit)